MLDTQILENEQVIFDASGEPEYIILPVKRYEALLKMLEDYGLGQAMLEAEKDLRLSRKEALAALETEEAAIFETS